ncbi:transposase-like protein, IS1381 ISSpn7 [Streptococcus pneumoniae]|nr:transposase-like protein, IS1381 ISSpn7 [Streptococcus pneumoniae]
MNDEASKQLTDARFKRLVGVQRTTFEEILAVLKTAYQLKHAFYMCENTALMKKLRLILVSTKATYSVGANGLK